MCVCVGYLRIFKLTKALGSASCFLGASIRCLDRRCDLMHLELGLGARLLVRGGRDVSVELFIRLVGREETGVGENARKGIQLSLIEGRHIARAVIVAVLLVAGIEAIVVEIAAQALRYALLIGTASELFVLAHQALLVLVLAARAVLDVVALPLLGNAAAIVALELVAVAKVAPARRILALVRLMRIRILAAVEQLAQLVRVGNRNGTGLQNG